MYMYVGSFGNAGLAGAIPNLPHQLRTEQCFEPTMRYRAIDESCCPIFPEQLASTQEQLHRTSRLCTCTCIHVFLHVLTYRRGEDKIGGLHVEVFVHLAVARHFDAAQTEVGELRGPIAETLAAERFHGRHYTTQYIQLQLIKSLALLSYI